MKRSSVVPSAFRTASGLRPVATTLFPAASAALAISEPIPRVAPVTNHTLLMRISFWDDHRKPKPGRVASQARGAASQRGDLVQGGCDLCTDRRHSLDWLLCRSQYDQG